MNCSNCHFDNPADARFCQNCGRPLDHKCPNCGTENAPGAKFCKNCGYQLAGEPVAAADHGSGAVPPPAIPPQVAGPAAASERRVVTILFCDVKGSTTLAEQLDPETWTEVMDGAFDYLVAAVVRYDGTGG